MKAVFLIVVLTISGLAACTTAEQERTVTSEREILSQLKEDTAGARSQAADELRDLKKNAVKGFHQLRDESVNVAIFLSGKTEDGAELLAQAAKELEQLSHDAKRQAGELRDTIRRVDAAIKNAPADDQSGADSYSN